jgi:spore germination protein YaaH
VKAATRLLLAVVLAVLSTAGAQPAQAATLHRSVSLWMPYWQFSAAYSSALANASVIGTASPFWYAISGDSTLVSHPGAGDRAVINGLHAKGIKVVPTVTESQDLPHFVQMLESDERRTAHLRTLVNLVRSRSYDGLELDYEHFVSNPTHNAALAQRAATGYTRLVEGVCWTLHRLNKTCTVAVLARTSDAQPEDCGWCTWIFDYRAIGAAADRVRVMAYEQHGAFSTAGPISSIAWVRSIIGYAGQTMPPRKVELGLPAFGFDWSRSGTRSVTSRAALALAARYKAVLHWDATVREYTFAYTVSGVQHRVWFEERVAGQQRASLAKWAGFAGTAFWAGGGEDLGLWPRLRALYTY